VAFLARSRWSTRLAAACIAASALGCMLLDSGERRARGKLAFSHARHVGQEGLECSSCHESYAMSDDPGMPELESCMACHETIDAEKPAERRIETLFADGKFVATHAAALSDELVFSHQKHASGELECASCHAEIETNDRIDESIGVSMQRCVDCHAERSVKAECETCHTVIREEWPPPSHDAHWKRMHGGVVRSGSLATADTCSICHSELTCIACHKDEPPESHTNFFRRRGHGITAMMDRQTCAACHEPASCDRCHAEVRPRNHSARWGAPQNNHCLVCHFPLRSEACITCHKTTTSHNSAAPKPPWHTPVMNCRQCHGLSEPLPHVDNGDDCNICHL
jgi:hypothetical protein